MTGCRNMEDVGVKCSHCRVHGKKQEDLRGMCELRHGFAFKV